MYELLCVVVGKGGIADLRRQEKGFLISSKQSYCISKEKLKFRRKVGEIVTRAAPETKEIEYRLENGEQVAEFLGDLRAFLLGMGISMACLVSFQEVRAFWPCLAPVRA